ncbi:MULTISPECIES: class I SAM-dependent methyltransferase [Bacillus]|uniref:class I SAM-dependent methyltransferase n=1 Tax=Bacillus TaxID=1386 RepID=UPI0030F5C2C8
MKPTYQDALAAYGIGGAHPGGLSLTRKILKKENISRRSKILDVGCGTGQTAAFLSKSFRCSVTALDNHPTMIQKAKQRFSDERLPVHAIQGNVESLPFSDASFDFVLSESVTAFTNIADSLKEYCRVLKPGGVLLMIEMTAEKPFQPLELKDMKKVYGISNVFLETEWIQHLHRSGFVEAAVIFSNTVQSELQKNSPEKDDYPEYQISDPVDPQVEELLHEHMNLSRLYQNILGYRVYRAVRPSLARNQE